METHDTLRLKRRGLLSSTSIIASFNIKRKLFMIEAVLIKDNKVDYISNDMTYASDSTLEFPTTMKTP